MFLYVGVWVYFYINDRYSVVQPLAHVSHIFIY